MNTYYKVKPEFDGLKISYKTRSGKIEYIELVANELFTTKETLNYNIPTKCTDIIKENENNIYWFFGARFNS